jgi:DNA-binding NtrC family response regulator
MTSNELAAHLRGSSRAFGEFAEDLARVAASDAAVLLVGESGSGKGAATRALHALSERRAGPLVQVDLAALSPTLTEAALFGHERGAFTDAHVSRQGAFRRAEGGILVLDDVDLLPLAAQAKLLRVLQEKVVEPLGSEEVISVDARVVATTNRDLRHEIEQGRFREDLWYRLAVVVLTVPPLRARVDDVPDLARHFAAAAAERLGVPVRPLSEAAVERLAAHPWPGNVRELENALERVVVLGSGDPDAPPVAADELDFLEESVAGADDELAARALAMGLDIDTLVAAMLRQALRDQRGNKSAAARQLGLTRRALDYRLSRLEGAAEEAPPEEEDA